MLTTKGTLHKMLFVHKVFFFCIG